MRDESWAYGPSNSKSKPSGNCTIHCTDASGNLVSLQSANSWKVLLKAGTICQHETVLKAALSLLEGVMPYIKCH